MSRSRPPKCPTGRGCWVCDRPDLREVARAVERLSRKEVPEQAQEYLELPYWPEISPDAVPGCTCPLCVPEKP